MRIKIHLDIKIGRVIKYLLLVDLLFFGGWGFIQPIFAVFVVEEVTGATVVTAGALAAVYWILKSLLQLPLARLLDKTPGEKDDFYALISGFFLASIAAFLFVLVDKIWQLYAVQIVYSVAMALYVVSWPALFSRHLDKDQISFDWALNSSTVGLATGVSGLLGGVVANAFGFEAVFVLVALFSAASAMVLLLVPDLVFPKDGKETNVPPEIKAKPLTPTGH